VLVGETPMGEMTSRLDSEARRDVDSGGCWRAGPSETDWRLVPWPTGEVQ
jgi:hypothetical protein